MLELQTKLQILQADLHRRRSKRLLILKVSSPKTTTIKTNTRVSASQRRPAPIYEIQSLSLQLYHLPILELQTTLTPHIARRLIVKNLTQEQSNSSLLRHPAPSLFKALVAHAPAHHCLRIRLWIRDMRM